MRFSKCLCFRKILTNANSCSIINMEILYKYNIQRYSSGETAKKAVVQIDKNTNEVIAVFPSATEAELAVPTGKHINQVCKGSRKTAGGYKWAYFDFQEDNN